jgi:hypothetical protein
VIVWLNIPPLFIMLFFLHAFVVVAKGFFYALAFFFADFH